MVVRDDLALDILQLDMCIWGTHGGDNGLRNILSYINVGQLRSENGFPSHENRASIVLR